MPIHPHNLKHFEPDSKGSINISLISSNNTKLKKKSGMYILSIFIHIKTTPLAFKYSSQVIIIIHTRNISPSKYVEKVTSLIYTITD